MTMTLDRGPHLDGGETLPIAEVARRTGRRLTALLTGAVLTTVLSALSACAGGDGAPPAAGSPSGAASTAPDAPLHTGFSAPTGLAFDHDGTVYVSNWSGGTVERITPDGQRSTFVDVQSPSGLAIDGQGNLYVASYSGDVVHRVTRSGERQEFATGFNTPAGISFDAAGNLLVCNRDSDEIMRVTPEGAVSRVAGGLSTPVGVVEDSDGTIYVSNYVGGVLSRIHPDGRVVKHSDDFEGLGVGMAIHRSHGLFVTDLAAGRIMRVERDGSAVPVMSGLDSPVALAIDHEGALHTATWGDGALYRVRGN